MTDDALRGDAERQCLAVAERLLRPETVTEALAAGAAGSLADGLPGTALLHARLAVLHPDFTSAAADHWTHAARQTPRDANHLGVFHAGAGLAASLIIGVPYLPDPASYATSTTRATHWLSAQAVALAEHHRAALVHGSVSTPWHIYDVITGLAGAGRVLLAAHQSGHAAAEPGLLAALTTLARLINQPAGSRPGWWLPADRHPAAVNAHPSGAATTGMAHGIAGPLALLAIGHQAGCTVPGQRDAITQAAAWLLRWRDERTGTWPPHITGDELDAGRADPPVGRADAWCYGIPGISRALTLAGQAGQESTTQDATRDALRALADRPGRWDVDGPTLCHGHAGVLRTAHAMHHPVLARQAATAVADAFDPTHRFCFAHVAGSTATDRPGFLTGAAGTALALAEHAAFPVSHDLHTAWDALLLLS
ncbi:lanthionine synthetase C family protein [Pseudofrankia inefficax]|uniref:Lanthionine synthetase C family protein n=1 Tax=Pseudofrankia inefficax (strain DSM 45817 / CECT 9037 / DDB 130130 / EuI1c) TaxID=298654 RepID=E3IWB5_PSEI1|nr:lanthionine synthetase C family protein [Pseudofrankia inefficax]ADP78957.1 Lanthionine synthetase C family protein [Pseudofrankia inefficax]